MKKNEPLDPIDVACFCANRELFASNDIAHLLEQFFWLANVGEKQRHLGVNVSPFNGRQPRAQAD